MPRDILSQGDRPARAVPLNPVLQGRSPCPLLCARSLSLPDCSFRLPLIRKMRFLFLSETVDCIARTCACTHTPAHTRESGCAFRIDPPQTDKFHHQEQHGQEPDVQGRMRQMRGKQAAGAVRECHRARSAILPILDDLEARPRASGELLRPLQRPGGHLHLDANGNDPVKPPGGGLAGRGPMWDRPAFSATIDGRCHGVNRPSIKPKER